MNESYKPSKLAWLVFSITASFYAYEFFLRVAPAALQADIMKQFSINAEQFGILMSAYYVTYTPLQLFVGSIMDLYGPKKTLIIAILSCLIGAVCFVQATYFGSALLAYALIGFGSAFAFVGVLKLSSNWLPNNYLAIASGIATSMGMVGAITGEYILDLTVHTYGYKNSFITYFLIGCVILLGVIFVVRDQPHKAKISKRAPIKFKTLIRDLIKLRHNGQFWLNALIGCLLFMPTNIFASMWAVMFFKQSYHLASSTSNAMSSILFAGWAIGAPISGYLVSRGLNIINLLRLGSIVSAFSLGLIIFHEVSDTKLILALMFSTGLFSSVQILVFPNAVQFIDRKYSGTAISLTNMVIMLSSFFSPLVGFILDLSWEGKIENNVHIFSNHGFEQALMMLPLGLGISFFCTYFMKESKV
ncbi:MAG: MFS transporter [Pseudomonadota bacterium]|nr:MFS transporter [Pseudomonadota bacterium]